jgi:hypothetical protein
VFCGSEHFAAVRQLLLDNDMLWLMLWELNDRGTAKASISLSLRIRPSRFCELEIFASWWPVWSADIYHVAF